MKSLTNVCAAVLAAGVASALSLAPLAGLSGMALAKTQETMTANLTDLTNGDAPTVTTVTDNAGSPMRGYITSDVSTSRVTRYHQ